MRGTERPGKASLAGSAAIHVVAVLLVWATSAFRRELPPFETIDVTIYSPPPTVEADEPTPAPEEELVIETPDEPAPEETTPEPEPEEVQQPEPEPEENPPPPDPESEETPETEPAGPDPVEADEGGEDVEIRLEGLRRDFPEYYANIVNRIRRCHRWRGGGRWETSVYFVIEADGTVSDLRFVAQSGNPQFDLEAIGAVDCASDRFGPLPDEYRWDRLPIRFNFRPTGVGGVPR